MVLACSPSTERWRKEDRKFKVNLNFGAVPELCLKTKQSKWKQIRFTHSHGLSKSYLLGTGGSVNWASILKEWDSAKISILATRWFQTAQTRMKKQNCGCGREWLLYVVSQHGFSEKRHWTKQCSERGCKLFSLPSLASQQSFLWI